MTKRSIPLTWALAATAAVALGQSVNAAEVTRSVLLDHPPAKVWEMIGDYAALDAWHPAVAKLELSGDDSSGLYRTLTLEGGGTLKERLQSHSPEGMAYSYSIESGVLPVKNYVSKLSVRAAKHDPEMAVVEWSSTFDPLGIGEKEIRDVIGGIYSAGFSSLTEKLK